MKKISSLLLILALCLNLTACRSSFSGDRTTIDVITAQYGPNTAYWWLRFEQDFEAAHPSVDMRVDVVSWNDIHTVVDSRIACGDPPDIVNIDVFANYQAQGRLLPIDRYASDAVRDKMLPVFLEQSQIGSEIWALPVLSSARVLFYNKAILEESGAQVPQNWEELCQTAQAVKDHFGGEVYPWGVDATTNEGHACFAYHIWSNGSDFLDEQGRWALNSSENVEALEFIVEMVGAGLTNPDPIVDTRYDLQEMFASGKLAMMIGPNQIASYVANSAEPVSFGVAHIPVREGVAPVYGGVVDRFLCFDNSQSQEEMEAITAFFDFFYQDQRYIDWVAMEDFLPVTDTGARLMAEADPAVALWMSILGFCRFPPVAETEWAEVKQGIVQVEQLAMYGGDAQQLLDDLQARITGQ